jgi:hypothetical protein
MQVESGALVPNQAFHCLDFDADSGCYVFLSDAASATTWAYRPPQRSRAAATGANPVADLAVSLDFGGGRVATFSGRNATDQGDFVGQFVRQKSYLALDPAFPDWRVYLRVDADAGGARIAEPGAGWRDEVIVEYGRSTHGAPAHVTAAYTATITKGGQVRATYAVPKHWWYARWRWQSAERPVVRTPAEIKARGWIPNFGAGGLFGLAANSDAVRWDGPMCAPVRQPPLQAFNPYMPSGGDNPQIGFLTEYAADYVLTGSDASLRSVRTEGEWCGNWCMHVRDDRTGAPLDVRGGALQWKSNSGTVNDAPAGNSNTDPNFVSLDCAHFYPCANLPWLLTEDPFYLEELQFGVNWHLLYNNWPRERLKLQGLMYPGQTRAYAWGLRQLFLVAATTPASTPGWLRPQRYWRDCVADNKAFAMQFVRSPARIHKLFRTWTVSDMVPAWQCAWLNAVVGMAVDQGFLDWGPVFAWGVDLHIQQSNGKSGWPRQWPVPYYSMPNRVGYNTYVALPYTDTAPDATTCTSWADYWAYYASGSDGHSDTTGHRIDPTGWDGRTIMQQFYDVGPSYLLHLRAVLAVAVTRRIPGAQACYDYIQGELTQSVMPHYGNHEGQARFSIDPDPHPRVAASFEGLWSQAGANDGWTLSVEHQAEVILAGWFTFDAAGAPRWLSLIAGKADADREVYSGSLYRTSGPPFDATPFDPAQVMRNEVGVASLTFADDGSGTFDAVVDGKPFSAPIARYAFADPVPACGFGVLQDLTEATNYQGVWWAAPAESESGWGVSIAHQGDVLLATWFTYDAAGQPLWLSAVAPQRGPADYVGTLYESRAATGSPPVQRTPAGAVAFTFLDGNDGQFTYSYKGVTQTRAITREVFRLPGTVCET